MLRALIKARTLEWRTQSDGNGARPYPIECATMT